MKWKSPIGVARTTLATLALLASAAGASAQTMIQPTPAGIDWSIIIRESASISCSGPRIYGEWYLGVIGQDGNVRGSDLTLMQTWLRTVPQARALGDQLRADLHAQYQQNFNYRNGICRIVGRAPGIDIVVTDAWSRPGVVTTRRFNDPGAAGGWVSRVIDFGRSQGLVPPALVPVFANGQARGGAMNALAGWGEPTERAGLDSADFSLIVAAGSTTAPTSTFDSQETLYPEPESEFVPVAGGFAPRAELLDLFFQHFEEIQRLARPPL